MEKIIDILKSAGYKLTKQRKEVICAIIDAQKPVSLKDIQNNCSSIDFASIYRIVNLLLELNIVRKVNFGERYLRYEIETEHMHHHHIVCSKCGSIKKIDYCLVEELENLTNFKILEHSMEFIGLCPKCKNK